MSYVLPTISDFKSQFVRDFPYATPLAPKGVVAAVLVAALNGDKVSGITISSGGSGYANRLPVSAVVYGGGGVGCQAALTLTAGAVTGVNVTNPGFGYLTPPLVYVGAGGDNTNDELVTDFDLAQAFTAAFNFNISPGLFGSQAAFTYALNLLAAHQLCSVIRAGASGLFGQPDWLLSSKSAGDVASSFSIPDRVKRSPIFARLSKTTYGMQFIELVSPQIIGNLQAFHRDTLP